MTNDINAIQTTINDYFLSTHEGDIARIESAFHPDCKITGFINEQYVEMTLTQFCERVIAATRADSSAKYDKQMISIDQHSNVAMVKARVLVGELYFTDYITLMKLDGKWVIRQKSFTDA